MSIIEQVQAKNKAEDVINSCENLRQLETANKYVMFYYKKFEDYLSYQYLLNLITEKHTKYDKIRKSTRKIN
jgi:hypothetical protein